MQLQLDKIAKVVNLVLSSETFSVPSITKILKCSTTGFWPISHKCSISIPPENVKNTPGFWRFQGYTNRKLPWLELKTVQFFLLPTGTAAPSQNEENCIKKCRITWKRPICFSWIFLLNLILILPYFYVWKRGKREWEHAFRFTTKERNLVLTELEESQREPKNIKTCSLCKKKFT